MEINTSQDGSFVFSSGKDMGVFKGVGYPEEIAEYFRLEEYKGYLWTAHGRFPTNTAAWWGGAHPFSILDWTVVHNGEISSYGINRRYLEQFGYQCTMQTDTEVIAYAIDLLMRRHGLPLELAAKVLAAPFWDDIERLPEEQKRLMTALRQVYGSLLLNGPFAVIIAHTGEMIGLTDRIRLRPLTVGEKGDMLYLVVGGVGHPSGLPGPGSGLDADGRRAGHRPSEGASYCGERAHVGALTIVFPLPQGALYQKSF